MANTFTMASICFSMARLSLIFLPAMTAADGPGLVSGDEAEGGEQAPTSNKVSSLEDLKYNSARRRQGMF
jgi:hypothetical protein